MSGMRFSCMGRDRKPSGRQAVLLSADEQDALSASLDDISERGEVDVVIVTTDSLGGKTAQEYADDYFTDYGYGQGEDRDGILFLVDMETETGPLPHMDMPSMRLRMQVSPT